MSIETERAMTGTAASQSRRACVESNDNELNQLKLELLKAEVRLAKARAGVACAEADVKVLSVKLKACTSR